MTTRLIKQIENRKRKEEKEAQKLQNKDSSDEDDDDEEEESEEEEDNDDDKDEKIDGDGEVNMQDETKQNTITDNQLGFAEHTEDTNKNDENVMNGNDEEVKGGFDGDQESDSDQYGDLDPMFDLLVRIDTMQCTFQKLDSKQLFKDSFKSLHQRAPQEIDNIVQQLDEQSKVSLQQLFQTISIPIVDRHGEEQVVTRRIVKVRRNPNAQTTQFNLSQDSQGAQKQKLELPI